MFLRLFSKTEQNWQPGLFLSNHPSLRHLARNNLGCQFCSVFEKSLRWTEIHFLNHHFREKLIVDICTCGRTNLSHVIVYIGTAHKHTWTQDPLMCPEFLSEGKREILYCSRGHCAKEEISTNILPGGTYYHILGEHITIVHRNCLIYCQSSHIPVHSCPHYIQVKRIRNALWLSQVKQSKARHLLF